MGVGLNLALLKENSFGDPRLLSFFLKGIIIVHELKIKFYDFQHQIFLYMIYSKNKFQFFTNYQNISCSILSQHGKTNKLEHFLEGLRSWAII